MTADRLEDVRAWMEGLHTVEPDFSMILRRAHGAPRRLTIGVATLAVVLVLAVVLPLGALLGLAPSGRNQTVPPMHAEDIEPALAFAIPEGWDTRTYETRDKSVTVFEIATFSLAEAPATLNGVRRLMSEDDVYIHVADWTAVCPCEGFPEARLPLSVSAADFRDPVVERDVWNAKRMSSPHSWIGRTWYVEGRSLAVFADIAAPDAAPQGVEAVNAVLHSLEVTQPGSAPAPSGDCPAIGPWSDPDCPASRWVRTVLDEAGLSLVGDTGSALVVESGDHRFHVWTTSADGPLSEADLARVGYSKITTIDGITVYFDGVRYVWTEGSLNVWVTSATEEVDLPPSLIRELVVASAEITFELQPTP